jgi:thiosulfate/3-mercaptopyruvate sulfurtransferase
MLLPSCLVVCLLSAPIVSAAPTSYARPDLLIEPATLAKPAVARKSVILDVRTRASYLEGHIPGAIWVDATAWNKAFAAGEDRAAWVKRVGAAGINVDTPVVIYEAGRPLTAARVWWILRYWGVRDVRLLNGGLPGWTRAGGKVEKDEVKPKPTEPKLVAQPARLATKDQIGKWLKEKSRPQIVDARSSAEFCGDAGRARRTGHIPGAKHLDWVDTIDPKTGRFKSAEELTKLFKEAGIDPRRPATTYCQSGGRASVLAFTLELMGGKEVRNYYRSWSEWGNATDTPVEKPKPKK